MRKIRWGAMTRGARQRLVVGLVAVGRHRPQKPSCISFQFGSSSHKRTRDSNERRSSRTSLRHALHCSRDVARRLRGERRAFSSRGNACFAARKEKNTRGFSFLFRRTPLFPRQTKALGGTACDARHSRYGACPAPRAMTIACSRAASASRRRLETRPLSREPSSGNAG
jgi:hypothetical protein